MSHGWRVDDYKQAQVEQEQLRQETSTTGWIYIGVDIRANNIAKMGYTSGSLGTRASGTQNPFYDLLYAFKIKDGVGDNTIRQIDSAVKRFLERHYRRIPFVGSGKRSEWFEVNPSEMQDVVEGYLERYFLQFMYSYLCPHRGWDVIHSWENGVLMGNGPRTAYKAADLSGPPVDSRCYHPPGCGIDCNCWG